MITWHNELGKMVVKALKVVGIEVSYTVEIPEHFHSISP